MPSSRQEVVEVAEAGMPYRVAREVGDRGEDVACAHLLAQGWQVLQRNWRCASGELDIVVRDGDTLVFCEVKTRRSARYGSPAEAVTPQKLHRLRRLAGLWLGEHGVHARSLRIDVIAVVLPPAGAAEVQHLVGVGS